MPQTIRRILVPLDGSQLALAALETAHGLALATQAEIVLATVIPDLAQSLDWGNEFIPELAEIEAEMSVAARDALMAVQERLPGVKLGETAGLRGPIAETLEDYIHQHEIDLTVLCSHGRGGLERVVLGSTATHLVHSGVPVLIVHLKLGSSIELGRNPA